MIGATLLGVLYTFVDSHKGDIASKIIASAGYDGLKKTLNFGTLKTKLGSFFKKDEDKDKFIETICEQKMMTDGTGEDEIKTAYENITGETFDNDIIPMIKEWLTENKQAIQNLNITTNSGNSGGFNIGAQNAGNNILNIQGDHNAENK